MGPDGWQFDWMPYLDPDAETGDRRDRQCSETDEQVVADHGGIELAAIIFSLMSDPLPPRLLTHPHRP